MGGYGASAGAWSGVGFVGGYVHLGVVGMAWGVVCGYGGTAGVGGTA